LGKQATAEANCQTECPESKQQKLHTQITQQEPQPKTLQLLNNQ